MSARSSTELVVLERYEQVWGVPHADVIKNGMAAEQAAAKALHRAEEIFAQHPINQS